MNHGGTLESIPDFLCILPQNSPSIILCVHFCALHMYASVIGRGFWKLESRSVITRFTIVSMYKKFATDSKAICAMQYGHVCTVFSFNSAWFCQGPSNPVVMLGPR